MEIKAISSANLLVHFYVLDGSAEVVGSKLVFTAILPQSKFPASVTVVAWHYEPGVKPKVKTVKAVAQTLYINEPLFSKWRYGEVVASRVFFCKSL